MRTAGAEIPLCFTFVYFLITPAEPPSAHFPERPGTPVLAPTATPESSRDAAAVLIQRLLRGRAAQNAMYEGRMRRQALIEELKLEATDAGERR